MAQLSGYCWNWLWQDSLHDSSAATEPHWYYYHHIPTQATAGYPISINKDMPNDRDLWKILVFVKNKNITGELCNYLNGLLRPDLQNTGLIKHYHSNVSKFDEYLADPAQPVSKLTPMSKKLEHTGVAVIHYCQSKTCLCKLIASYNGDVTHDVLMYNRLCCNCDQELDLANLFFGRPLLIVDSIQIIQWIPPPPLGNTNIKKLVSVLIGISNVAGDIAVSLGETQEWEELWAAKILQIVMCCGKLKVSRASGKENQAPA
ncbi:hypothetical protein BDN71DRAFT_1432913 [Pleurotus eryngii]|uniref:Uncharacterized protein n=1 Tax=Pleurotus eryngii TaxID=5323 RepID=A0A9P5ZV20_PLEER|nr:hypothetical protein BDN71DRAFT_1432913 [Pleurotus eryngii]